MASNTDSRRQFLVAAAVFVGLFFLEYPPIFIFGYWSWSGTVHKLITGLLLVVNLVACQFAAMRITSKRRAGDLRTY